MYIGAPACDGRGASMTSERTVHIVLGPHNAQIDEGERSIRPCWPFSGYMGRIARVSGPLRTTVTSRDCASPRLDRDCSCRTHWSKSHDAAVRKVILSSQSECT